MENTTQTYVYTGKRALENMNEAVNYNRALIQLIEESHTLTPESSILDFGAGVGTFTQFMRDKGHNPACVEIDEEECAHLRNQGFTVFEDIEDVEDGMHDLIYSLNVLEHIHDHVDVLGKLRKKLKPEGKLFIYVPAFQSLYSEFDAMLGHVRRYHKHDLRSTIEEAGLRVEKIRYFDTMGFFAAYAFKMLRSKPEQVTKGKIRFFDRLVFPLNRIVEPIFNPFLGKNLYVVCTKGE